MLFDLLMNLITAGDPEDREAAYRQLEKVGIDRMTADSMAAEFEKEAQ